MMRKIVNFYLGPREDRVLKTGLHTVADVHCRCCTALLGWKYLAASDLNQRKVGKYILEKALIVKLGAGERESPKDNDGWSRHSGSGVGYGSGLSQRGPTFEPSAEEHPPPVHDEDTARRGEVHRWRGNVGGEVDPAEMDEALQGYFDS